MKCNQCCVLIILLTYFTSTHCQNRSFTIDYNRNIFLKDGEEFRYISGSFHYFRSVEEYWDDVLNKFRLGGLNAVQTYVEWSSHQPTPNETFNFDGNLNIFKFLEIAQKNDLLVILRPGPYICAERDMGGLPSWLLWQKQDMNVRSNDLDYVYFVSRWLDYFLPLLRPYLYSNGGPIIMIQIENEFGSYACTHDYTSFLRDLFRLHLGNDIVLFTTDGPSEIKCGAIPDVFPTVDFGTSTPESINSSFNIQQLYSKGGPLVNSEFYPGWLDHWGSPHEEVAISPVLSTLDNMLSIGASVNIYMYYGGTSFGYGSGSNTWEKDGKLGFDPCPTSYDYDAPLTEARDPTLKYFAIKDVIAKYKKVPDEIPMFSKKVNYGEVKLQPMTHFFNNEFLSMFSSSSTEWDIPLTFEQLKVGPSGFVLYSTLINIRTKDPTTLSLSALHDRGYVFVDASLVGVLSRSENILSMPIFVRKGQFLSILVENQGRPSYANLIGEWKGLGENVTLGNTRLYKWAMSPIEMDGGKLNKLAKTLLKSPTLRQSFWKTNAQSGGGGLFWGNFNIPANTTNSTYLLDTFVRLDGWTKGSIWINGFNLGRYWPVVGPQETLYLPGPLLKREPEENIIVVLELEQSPSNCFADDEDETDDNCSVVLTDTHVINGPTPTTGESVSNTRNYNNILDNSIY